MSNDWRAEAELQERSCRALGADLKRVEAERDKLQGLLEDEELVREAIAERQV